MSKKAKVVKATGPHMAWFRKGEKFTYPNTVSKPKKPSALKGHHVCPCGSGKKYRKCCRVSVGKGE